jgi:hypothetical protein
MTNSRYAPEGVIPTPKQWVNMFLDSTPDKQLDIASRVLDNSDVAGRCFMYGHESRIAYLAAEVRTLNAMLPPLGGGCTAKEL